MVIISIFTPKAFSNFLPTNGESSFFSMIPRGGLAFPPRLFRDRSFFMGRGGRWFRGGHPKIFELKGGHPKS